MLSCTSKQEDRRLLLVAHLRRQLDALGDKHRRVTSQEGTMRLRCTINLACLPVCDMPSSGAGSSRSSDPANVIAGQVELLPNSRPRCGTIGSFSLLQL